MVRNDNRGIDLFGVIVLLDYVEEVFNDEASIESSVPLQYKKGQFDVSTKNS